MKINVFLGSLMFCAVLILTGGEVLTLSGDDIIKTGYYVWKTSSIKDAAPSDTQQIYIESYNNGFDIYTTSGICYHVNINGNKIIARAEIGQKTIDINGEIISKELIKGECKVFSESSNKTDIIYFAIVPDLTPQKDSDYFKKLYRATEEKNEELIYPKTSAYGLRMRAEIEKMAKEEDISFIVKGKVIDINGQPIDGIIIYLSARAYDPDGPMGMKCKIKYLTSNKDGYFESEVLTGNSLSISYKGKEYQFFNVSLSGKDKLLGLKNKPIIIKLIPNVKSR